MKNDIIKLEKYRGFKIANSEINEDLYVKTEINLNEINDYYTVKFLNNIEFGKPKNTYERMLLDGFININSKLNYKVNNEYNQIDNFWNWHADNNLSQDPISKEGIHKLDKLLHILKNMDIINNDKIYEIKKNILYPTPEFLKNKLYVNVIDLLMDRGTDAELVFGNFKSFLIRMNKNNDVNLNSLLDNFDIIVSRAKQKK